MSNNKTQNLFYFFRLKLAEKGFNVAFCARRQERLDELKSEGFIHFFKK